MFDIGTVRLADFLIDPSGSCESLTLVRGESAPNKHDVSTLNPGKLPSKKSCPPCLGLHASLRLGKRIGKGSTGYVFEVDLEKDSGLSSKMIPPLVVKVCRPNKYYKMEREAYYYEHLEELQGSVIPRCYGHFQSVVAPDLSVSVWPIERRRRQELGSVLNEYNEEWAEDGEDGEDHIGYPRVLTILLLERLKLPVAVTDDDIERFK